MFVVLFENGEFRDFDVLPKGRKLSDGTNTNLYADDYRLVDGKVFFVGGLVPSTEMLFEGKWVDGEAEYEFLEDKICDGVIEEVYGDSVGGK